MKPLRFMKAIFYCRSVCEVDEAVSHLLKKPQNQEQIVLGFDIEWFATFEKGAVPHRAATIQLCNDNCCAVFQASSFERVDEKENEDSITAEEIQPRRKIPASLSALLKDCSILKVGVGASRDAVKVKKDYNEDVNGVIDIEIFATRLRDQLLKTQSMSSSSLPSSSSPSSSSSSSSFSTSSLLDYKKNGFVPFGDKLSLAGLCEDVLGRQLSKPPHIRLSNWEAEPLSDAQLSYAACDAYAGYRVYEGLLQFVPSVDINKSYVCSITNTEILEPALRAAYREYPRQDTS